MTTDVLSAALAALRADISVIPIDARTKQPYFALLPRSDDGKPTWKPYQERHATEDEVRAWAEAGAQFAAVGGTISGGLECIDSDDVQGRTLTAPWRSSAGDLAATLTHQRTGGDGDQFAYRYPIPDGERRDGNQKLAWLPDDTQDVGRSVAIETRGEGGYFVIAPSLHPSGKRYELLNGSWDTIPTITHDQRNALLDAARSLDEMPYTRQQAEAQVARAANAQPKATTYRASLNGTAPVIDAYNKTRRIDDELRAHGYQDAAHGRLIRPNADTHSQPGVVLGDSDHVNMSFHHSSNDVLNDGYWHSPFDVRCMFDFHEDIKEAVAAIAVELGIDYLSNNPDPKFDADDRPHCPNCGKLLKQSKNGHGWRCLKPGGEICYFWDGDDAHPNTQTAANKRTNDAPIPVEDDPRPRIKVRDLDIPEIVAPAWDALIAANDPPTLFRRDNVLYELAHDDAGALALAEVDKRRLRSRLARVALFVEERIKRNTTISWIVEPPSVILDDMLVRIDERVPLITRITRCPVVSADGSIIDTPGYHARARLYYDPRPGLHVPPIADKPTAANVEAARDLIVSDLLGEFPFVEDADKAHAVALFLLPFVRELIAGPTPLHLIEAPTPGSGKTLLASVLVRPALGTDATPITEGRDDAEWSKKLTSVLMHTPAAVLIDNVNRPLFGSALSTALTSTIHSDRLLGSNTMTRYPIRCTWLATANNPTMSGEIARRSIRIRIDPRVDQPWKRDGFKHPNLLAWTREHEGQLIAAALTLIRAGLATLAPACAPLGSFEHWTAALGGILHTAGIPGFLGNLDELYDRADTEGAAWRALVSAWWETHQDKTIGGGDVFDLYKAGDYDLNLNAKDDRSLKIAFGKRLTKQRDRVIGGYQVVNAGTKQRAQQWQLKKVSVVSVSECFSIAVIATDNEDTSVEVYEGDIPEGW